MPILSDHKRSSRAEPTAASSREGGFSLVELLVAMLITLIVSGAIYGLLASGQNAFRKEPLLTERQQNIRAAMDVIQADVATAGSGLGIPGYFVQAFARTNADATLLDGHGPNGADQLQMITYDGSCPTVPMSPPPLGAPPGWEYTAMLFPTCYTLPALMGVVNTSSWYIGKAQFAGGATGATANHVEFVAGEQPPAPFPMTSPATCGGTCPPAAGGAVTDQFVPVQVVRYEIANDTDGMTSLWRSTTGGFQILAGGPGGGYKAAPDPLGNWRLVARGIEDLQVTYTMAGPAGGPTVAGSPDLITGAPPTVYDHFVRSVRVVLSARSERAREAGTGTIPSPGSEVAFRGALTSVTTPRAVLVALKDAAGVPAGLLYR